jgi:hypothetical protein
MSAPNSNRNGRNYPPFRRGTGPQLFEAQGNVTPLAVATGRELVAPTATLRFGRLTSARGVRRAHARLTEWVLAGSIDSIVATRLSFILGHVLKALEAEQLARLQSKPTAPPDDYDLSRLDIEEHLALHSLLTKASLVAKGDVEPITDGTHAALAKSIP